MPDLYEVLNINDELGDHTRQIFVTVGVSNRHVHLSRRDMEILFGPDYELKREKQLSQPGEFAAEETLTVVGPKGALENVRVLGPLRNKIQVEISLTDGFKLGIKPPVRNSGNLEGTPGAVLVGPAETLVLEEGVILVARHIHMNSADAERYSLKDGQHVRVRFGGVRGLVMENVIVRVKPTYELELHVDKDEANAALLTNGSKVEILQ